MSATQDLSLEERLADQWFPKVAGFTLVVPYHARLRRGALVLLVDEPLTPSHFVGVSIVRAGLTKAERAPVKGVGRFVWTGKKYTCELSHAEWVCMSPILVDGHSLVGLYLSVGNLYYALDRVAS